MKIALTGATGFLGRYIAAEFMQAGYDLRGWHRPGSPSPGNVAAKLRPHGLAGSPHGLADQADSAEPGRQSSLEWLPGRLGDEAAADELVNGVSIVVHAGLYRSGAEFMTEPSDPLEYYRVNVLGSLRLLEAACRAGVQRFIFVSSGAVHEQVLDDRALDETHPLRPGSLYGAYKAAVETLIHAYGAAGKSTCCSVRPTAIYGVADPIESSKWYDVVRAVAAGQEINASGGGKVVHAGDVGRAIRILAETDQPIAGETFNCSDRFVSTYEIAEIARRLSGSEAVIRGPAKTAGHAMQTAKLRRLGMSFGGSELLESTVAKLLSADRSV